MNHHCQSTSCQIGEDHSSSCSSNTSCGCNCSCCQKMCCSSPADEFLALADTAWMEVLKEKIKDQIRSNDKKMDELAKIISEANHTRWHLKGEKEKSSSAYLERLKNAMGCSNK